MWLMCLSNRRVLNTSFPLAFPLLLADSDVTATLYTCAPVSSAGLEGRLSRSAQRAELVAASAVAFRAVGSRFNQSLGSVLTLSSGSGRRDALSEYSLHALTIADSV